MPYLQQLSRELGLDDYITFTGFQSGQPLLRALSAFDVGVIPDPKNTYNDKISMNKVFEYMSLGIPFVQFDLIEGRKIADDAALYAHDNDPDDLARVMGELIDSPSLRAQLTNSGQTRAKALLRWDAESDRLLSAYQAALTGPRRARQPSSVPATK